MSARPGSPPDRPRDSLSVELGNWFKANATGRGVFAIPVLLALVLVAAVAKTVLG